MKNLAERIEISADKHHFFKLEMTWRLERKWIYRRLSFIHSMLLYWFTFKLMKYWWPILTPKLRPAVAIAGSSCNIVAKRYFDLRVIRLTLLRSPWNRNVDGGVMAGGILVGDCTSIATLLSILVITWCTSINTPNFPTPDHSSIWTLNRMLSRSPCRVNW